MNEAQHILATIETMTTALAEADVERILSTYAPEAVVHMAADNQVSGTDNLRNLFVSLLEAGSAFTYEGHEVVVAGDTALHLMPWQGPTPDGSIARALSIAVLRRQRDGQWRMVIDHPCGDGIMFATGQS